MFWNTQNQVALIISLINPICTMGNSFQSYNIQMRWVTTVFTLTIQYHQMRWVTIQSLPLPSSIIRVSKYGQTTPTPYRNLNWQPNLSEWKSSLILVVAKTVVRVDGQIGWMKLMTAIQSYNVIFRYIYCDINLWFRNLISPVRV